MHSFLCRLEAEVSEVLGNKTYVGEKELEKLQYTEQVCLEDLAGYLSDCSKSYKFCNSIIGLINKSKCLLLIHSVSSNMQVLKETLRMYGPLIAITKCSPPGGITLNGYHIPGGTRLMVSSYMYLYLMITCACIHNKG